ncbi:MAG: ATP-binding protein [Eubacteriales bacterium]|nr:ATP-binding protein [Eubacteriales bacterium]
MDTYMDKLLEKLIAINQSNRAGNDVKFFREEEFAPEYKELIRTLNRGIAAQYEKNAESNEMTFSALEHVFDRETARLAQENLAIQKQLKKSWKMIENQNDVLTALCRDYVGMYRVNALTGNFEIYKITDRLRLDVEDLAKSDTNYTDTLNKYIEKYVIDDDKEYVRSMSDLDYVMERIRKGESFFIRYKVKENPQNVENFEIHFASSGKENVVVVGFRNVDDLVRKKEAYQLQKNHEIEEILASSQTGLWTIEMEEGKEPRMYTDKTMQHLLGVSEGMSPEEVYCSWIGGVEPGYEELVQISSQEIIRTGRSEVIYPWNHPEWGRIYVRCGGVPDYTFDKKGVKMKGYHQNITDTMMTRKDQDKKLVAALVEAKRANKAKTEFLSHMSHDIRTPINGILGMLKISEKNLDNPAKQEECRNKIKLAAEHLLSLINDVLDISKLESGMLNLVEEPFDIDNLMENCYSILRANAFDHGVNLEEPVIDMEHYHLLGSPLHLRQILINIISNAIKYNDRGGRVSVHLKETETRGDVAVCQFIIADTGIGMSKEFLKHLFEPFTQESNDARTKYNGTGLGMAITKNLIDQMKGSIFAESEVGKGSVFTVNIPVKIDLDYKGENIVKQSQDVPLNLEGIKLLLVEDNDLNREIVQYMLEDAGIEVVYAKNGEEAVNLFRSSRVGEFDGILMDIMMPVMNGLDASRLIRNMVREDAASIPILAMTANAFVEDIQMAMDAGMNEHLSKPLDMNRMFRAIDRHCKKDVEK